jgi:hypothetical protein
MKVLEKVWVGMALAGKPDQTMIGSYGYAAIIHSVPPRTVGRIGYNSRRIP